MPSPDFDAAFNALNGLRIVTDSFRTPETDSEYSSESQSKKSSPSIGRRRSVSSMKGLMPLTLSTQFPSSTTHLPIEMANMTGEGPEDSFPEMLARDLEMNTDVFTAQKMTAGAPVSVLTAEYLARQKAITRSLSCRPRASSPYHTASARIRLLGAIEEKDSTSSFREQIQSSDPLMETISDEDSFSESDESGGMPPPSFRYRHQSVVTIATSLASSTWKPSSQGSQNQDGPQPNNWIDCTSDEEEEADEDADDYFAPLSPLSALSPRPPTPPELELPKLKPTPIGGDSTGLVARRQTSHFGHRKSHSVSGGSPIGTPRRWPSDRSISESMNPIMLRPHLQINPGSAIYVAPTQLASPKSATKQQLSPSSPISQTLRPQVHRNFQSEGSIKRKPLSIHAEVRSETPLTTYSDVNQEVDFIPTGGSTAPLSRENLHTRPTFTPSPPASVQSWLNGSMQSYPTSFHSGDDLAKLVPLPPDVIETLRVSTACFPETMLLSSSLTIETIRSYSKKVRHIGTKVFEPTPPPSPTYSARKSLWRKVVSHRRPGHVASESIVDSMSVATLDGPKPWTPLKNVFGICSDYICDALYAHIVAYNYVSALVAKFPAAPKPTRQYGSIGHSEGRQEDIPKKAASLLGLSGGTDQLPVRVSLLTKRISSQMAPWMKNDMMATPQSTMSASQENIIRGIQAGLFKCIARLIASAKLMAENGSGEERVVDMATEDTDVFFMRSLCEIVRVSEEAN